MKNNIKGFTLLELVVVIALIITMVTVFLGGPPPNPHRHVDATIRAIQTAAQTAIYDADARGGEIIFTANTDIDGEIRGVFRAISGNAGTTTTSIFEAQQIVDLRNGVTWGAGEAENGPRGEDVSDGQIPGTIRCHAINGCNLGGEAALVYYITHVREPKAVAAMTITTDGIVEVFKYIPATDTWTREIR
jgi:prepilin-type N-terminal cleavage/methylation domain-containing protein